MQAYLNLMAEIIERGHSHPDRTGTGRRSLYGRQLVFDLRDGFPLITTRKMNLDFWIHELLWHISGSSDVRHLHQHGVKIWDHWAVTEDHIDHFIEHRLPHEMKELVGLKEFMQLKFEGSVGPIYGRNWRSIEVPYYPFRIEQPLDWTPPQYEPLHREQWDEMDDQSKEQYGSFEVYHKVQSLRTIDQLSTLIHRLQTKPYSSRHVMMSWIPENIPDESMSPQENVLFQYGALAPCPMFQQFFAVPGKTNIDRGGLSMLLYIRSSDVPIGLPANIAQYALLLAMIAQVVDREPYELIVMLGDAHIYEDQLSIAKEQCTREPHALPRLWLNPTVKDIDEFTRDDVDIRDYTHHAGLKYPISV